MTEEKRRPPPGITPLDTVVAFASRRRLRGAARLRRILRGHHEVTLTRVRTVDGLLFDLDVENVMEDKYGGGQRAWFGHPVRLTVKGEELPPRD